MGRISSSDNKEQWRKSQKRHTGLIHAYGTADRYGAEKQGAERTKKAMVESNAVNGRGCLLPGYCSFVFFGLQCQVSACADVRVRMTSGMPSVFVSEATGGAKGAAGGEQW